MPTVHLIIGIDGPVILGKPWSNNLQIRNIQIEAILEDRLSDFDKLDKEQVKKDAEKLYGKAN